MPKNKGGVEHDAGGTKSGRNNTTGQFVSEKASKKSPKTTVTEHAGRKSSPKSKKK